MKLRYLRVYPMYFAGGTGNTGDGIRMAQEVGADLWHMNCVSARLCAKFPDFPMGVFIDFSGGGWSQRSMKTEKEKAPAGFIIVDKYGRRYMTEELKPHTASYECGWFDSYKLEYPRVPSYHIFDRRRMEYGPLAQLSSGPTGPHLLYKWSRDNMVELRKGWIVKGETIAELAANLNMPPENLADTIDTWNRHCQAGSDSEFARNPLELVPLDEPPYFAIGLFPGGSIRWAARGGTAGQRCSIRSASLFPACMPPASAVRYLVCCILRAAATWRNASPSAASLRRMP
ncbi:MAG: FAD-binding protein [Dehalococcoidia bacterium]|nr:FAD-binding protein [Dehalococcoidia bacterium]